MASWLRFQLRRTGRSRPKAAKFFSDRLSYCPYLWVLGSLREPLAYPQFQRFRLWLRLLLPCVLYTLRG